MAGTDHKDPDYNIYQMVLTRLPFLADTPANELIISHYTWEAMAALEPCFNVTNATVPPNPDNVGDEQYYSFIQKSIIADIVSVYMLMRLAIQNTAGDADAGTAGTTGKYISKVKAGSVEVDYDIPNGKTALIIGSSYDSLRDQFRKAAVNKALTLGCIIDLCDASCVAALDAATTLGPDFLVVNACGCGSWPPNC